MIDIKTYKRIVPMIYAYSTPGVVYHDGWLKIGQTKKQTIEERINNQTQTADIRWKLEWSDNAMYKDGSGEYFEDHAFHDFLTIQKGIERQPKTEWFKIDPERSQRYFNEFAFKRISSSEQHSSYELRDEQNAAIEKTKTYFEQGGTEFLWNAKPRFGKTFTTFDLIKQMNFKKVLIVSNRPSISNSWAEIFYKYIGWQEDLCFVTDNDALKNKPGVMTRKEYISNNNSRGKGFVAFESLQGLKTSIYFGGHYDKLSWMAKEYKDGNGVICHGIDFDLLVIDEAQEGVETLKTEKAFENISRKHTLYLSGTPFKALANEQFSNDQIFNWSYTDEQNAKFEWNKDETNPYELMPRLALYTYKLSDMIYNEIQKGAQINEDTNVDYAFDLNEFFSTKTDGTFVYEDEVKKFINALKTQEKYPFSTPELREELSHTLWLLNRVQSAKALANLLKDDPVFSKYKIVVAAGDGRYESDDEIKNSYDKVKAAIANNDKTITISVGQLTVGVTIPEWTAVLMLCNLQSPSSYMQAAFRVQNPCTLNKDGLYYRKETSYIFDFDPARTLIVYDEFANNLSPSTINGKGTENDRKDNIKKLLNFFPVIGEDDEGKMVELDANQVLSIPRKIKSQEVVRHGFMSNFLFQNISNVFGAPGIVEEILNKIPLAHEETTNSTKKISGVSSVNIDENGEPLVPNDVVIGKANDIFGEKYYENLTESIEPIIDNFSSSAENSNDIGKASRKCIEKIKETIETQVLNPVVESYEMNKRDSANVKKEINNKLEDNYNKLEFDYIQQNRIAQNELNKKIQQSNSQDEVDEAKLIFSETMEKAKQEFVESLESLINETVKETPKNVVERIEKNKIQKEKDTIEDSVRDHLRGFARTIPSFIMAYGDGNLTLGNFDLKTEGDVFEEVTGITLDNFRFLRDGGDYLDSSSGEYKHFDGHLFNEIVFNDSIDEFWHKKSALANYFDENQTEDIFDYIPPQKTNQIFTPKSVVKKMVDELEEVNPGCFDDPNNTFADLYMKSGLYITEIVKRLYNNKKMKELIPNNDERLHHIFTKQVYGMAPTRIIYLISTNYILGFDENLKIETKNFVQEDAAEASINGTLDELVNTHFGDISFE